MIKTYYSAADKKAMKTTYGIIWQILNALDLSLDLNGWNPQEELTAKRFKITENRFYKYIEMLQNAGYVEGADIREDLAGEKDFDLTDLTITLEGIQFLLENSTMHKIAEFAEKNRAYSSGKRWKLSFEQTFKIKKSVTAKKQLRHKSYSRHFLTKKCDGFKPLASILAFIASYSSGEQEKEKVLYFLPLPLPFFRPPP